MVSFYGTNMLATLIQKFITTEAGGGLLLVAAAFLAMVAANSPLQEYYHLAFSHSVLLVINDGLMVLFFLVVGLEIKRELLEGELSSKAQAILPALAALGGVLLPAILYAAFNYHDPRALHGWATASATDIAFSLCVLVLCGTAIPASLKLFLTAIAVIDDLAAILIIALFYTSDLSLAWLALACACLIGLYVMGRRSVASLWPYVIIGVILWAAILASGVHATVAGVLLGVMMPLNVKHASGESLLVKMEHALHPWVGYAILPLFAFANSGIALAGHLSWDAFSNSITLGIVAGLFFGKQAGIFLFTWIPVKMKLAARPEGVSWLQIYGVALTAGIGFTMSLFIGGLAFPSEDDFGSAKLGIVAGSLLSALAGFTVLKLSVSGRRLS